MGLLAKWSVASLAAIALAPLAPAQQTGFRDLTAAWRAPDDHIPTPTCPNVNSTISNEDNADPPPSSENKPIAPLELTITRVGPLPLHVGEEFIATVRLKNIGTAPLSIPWQPDGEKVVRVSSDGTEEKYEVADVSFRLTTAKRRAPTPLQSEGALFAHPDDRSTYIDLEPGHWLEIKLKGTVACGLEECPGEIAADNHATLTAWWYQRVLTHYVKDCNEDHGSHKIREVDSPAFPVVVRAAPIPSGH
jgi:hypothetical protein